MACPSSAPSGAGSSEPPFLKLAQLTLHLFIVSLAVSFKASLSAARAFNVEKNEPADEPFEPMLVFVPTLPKSDVGDFKGAGTVSSNSDGRGGSSLRRGSGGGVFGNEESSDGAEFDANPVSEWVDADRELGGESGAIRSGRPLLSSSSA